jgi:REP element-mobilizing transposase RayT
MSLQVAVFVAVSPANRTGVHVNPMWSPSYFAVSVGGAPIEVLKQYIKDQSRPGRTGLESH